MQTTDDEFSSLKCRYASKRCWNLRAIKRNGERHNLCEMHRQKANSNQRRLDKKRKAGQAALGLPSHLSLHANGFSDLERRMRMRASIALKLEQELGAVPLTTQYIRAPRASPSLMELQRAAGLVAMGNSHTRSYSEMDAWRREPSTWINGAYPRESSCHAPCSSNGQDGTGNELAHMDAPTTHSTKGTCSNLVHAAATDCNGSGEIGRGDS